jgi:hypothetical protein
MTTLQAIIPDDIPEGVLAQAGCAPIRALVSHTLRAAVALPLPGLNVEEPTKPSMKSSTSASASSTSVSWRLIFEDYADKVIVTTIQKFSLAMNNLSD